MRNTLTITVIVFLTGCLNADIKKQDDTILFEANRELFYYLKEVVISQQQKCLLFIASGNSDSAIYYLGKSNSGIKVMEHLYDKMYQIIH